MKPIPCEHCVGSGWVSTGIGKMPCNTCSGQGNLMTDQLDRLILERLDKIIALCEAQAKRTE